jgi:hypothetical protein
MLHRHDGSPSTPSCHQSRERGRSGPNAIIASDRCDTMFVALLALVSTVPYLARVGFYSDD